MGLESMGLTHPIFQSDAGRLLVFEIFGLLPSAMASLSTGEEFIIPAATVSKVKAFIEERFLDGEPINPDNFGEQLSRIGDKIAKEDDTILDDTDLLEK